MRNYIDFSGPLMRIWFKFNGDNDFYRIHQDQAKLLVGLLTAELANLETQQRKNHQDSLEGF
jgi:hypothetical protein